MKPLLLNLSLASMALLGATNAISAPEFTLESPDLVAEKSIRPFQYWDQFGCEGNSTRPTLVWSNAPTQTKSFAVTFYDQDAPTGSGFWHWQVYNLPKDTTRLAETLPSQAIEGNTDLGKPGYFGPCPPIGRKHKYTFTVHALDVDTLPVPAGVTAPLTGFFIHQHSLAQATLSVYAGPRAAGE